MTHFGSEHASKAGGAFSCRSRARDYTASKPAIREDRMTASPRCPNSAASFGGEANLLLIRLRRPHFPALEQVSAPELLMLWFA
jgi:hypothetical protein